jgi:hypothetical protein
MPHHACLAKLLLNCSQLLEGWSVSIPPFWPGHITCPWRAPKASQPHTASDRIDGSVEIPSRCDANVPQPRRRGLPDYRSDCSNSASPSSDGRHRSDPRSLMPRMPPSTAHVGWDPGLKHLVYEERERSRADAKHARNGSVHIPFGSPFMYLVCRDGGFVRLVLLSQPDDNGLARGLLCTLSNPRGAIFIPVATPVFLGRLQAKETPQIGLIKSEDASYEGYQETLSSVTTEEFGTFIFPQGVVERRRGLTIVNS